MTLFKKKESIKEDLEGGPEANESGMVGHEMFPPKKKAAKKKKGKKVCKHCGKPC